MIMLVLDVVYTRTYFITSVDIMGEQFPASTAVNKQKICHGSLVDPIYTCVLVLVATMYVAKELLKLIESTTAIASTANYSRTYICLPLAGLVPV